MKKANFRILLSLLFAVAILLVACQKDNLEVSTGEVFSSKYTTLTLDDLNELPNPAASEQFAKRLFDLKDDGGLTEKELSSVGDPAQNEDLLYALLFTEKYTRNEILWSWDEPKDDEVDDRTVTGKWKWTGGNPIASMYASGFKKWPAYKVKNRFQDPCGEILKSGPVYQDCYKLCDADLPGPCQTQAVKTDILGKIIDDSPVNPYDVASQLLSQAGWPLEADVNITPLPVVLMNYERTVLSGNIVHYKFEISLGPDPHDKIAIHRVVKETAPNQPVETDKVFVLAHGDHVSFTSMALPGSYSSVNPPDFGIAVFLAENDVDVWGVDQAWALVPEATTDFNFMKEWGLAKNLADLRTGMAIARVARYLTSDYFSKMTLGGWSGGNVLGFAVLDHETQLDPKVRHAKNYIGFDAVVKTNHDGFRNATIGELTYNQDLWNNGTYQEYVYFSVLGHLALNDPQGASPFVPGWTNEQALLFGGINQWFGIIPFHYLAGVFENDFPVGYVYTKKLQWFEYTASLSSYVPLKYHIDKAIMISEFVDSPFDNHFGQIRVPMLNVSPAGGFGDLSKYASTQTGSPDVTHLIPGFLPPDLAMIDYGHIDLFLANNAETVVWQPVLEWMLEH